MDAKYKLIKPEDVYLSVLNRAATEEELAHGYPTQITGNYPSGNHFIDAFATLVRSDCRCMIYLYASALGLGDVLMFAHTVYALTGMAPKDWCDRYTLLALDELFYRSILSVPEIIDRLGFGTRRNLTYFLKKNKLYIPSEVSRRRHSSTVVKPQPPKRQYPLHDFRKHE